jgi:hypothetical protein
MTDCNDLSPSFTVIMLQSSVSQSSVALRFTIDLALHGCNKLVLYSE